MRIEWLNKKDNDRVILFFNGWGMDAGIVSKLGAASDVLMFYDYRTLSCGSLPDLKHYREIYVVAWSMGVWAAACVLPDLHLKKIDFSVALNGTERPVDDQYGIPCKIYKLTEKGMNEQGRKKFFSRMFTDKDECTFFAGQKSCRELPEVCEELGLIGKQCVGGALQHIWDRTFVSEDDMIFPAKNQLNWWKDKVSVDILYGGHYPFSCFKNWEEIISIKPGEKR